MKQHTTNNFNTLVEPAEDCPVTKAEIPVAKNDRQTVATMQYEMIAAHPYEFTSDDVIFEVFAKKNDLTDAQKPEARLQFFSKGQPCMRASPLTKRYGFGIHCDTNGKIALLPQESDKFHQLQEDDKVIKVKAMRSKRA